MSFSGSTIFCSSGKPSKIALTDLSDSEDIIVQKILL